MTAVSAPVQAHESRRPDYRRFMVMMRHYLRPHGRSVAVLASCLLVGALLQVALPQIVRRFIDAAHLGSSLQTLWRSAIAYIAVGLGAQALNVGATYVSADLGLRTTNTLRADLSAHLLSLDMSFHNERTPGEMIERVDGDVTAVANFFSQFILRLGASALLICGVVVALFVEDWRVGVALAAFVAIAVLTMNRLRDSAVAATTEERQASAEMFGLLEERLDGLDDIRANGFAAYTMRRFHERLRAFVGAAQRAWVGRSVVWRTVMALFGVAVVLALAGGTLLYRQGTFTIGTVYLLLSYTRMLFDPLEEVAHHVQDLQKAAAGLGRIVSLLDTTPQVRGGSCTTFRMTPGGSHRALSVCAVSVTFGYAADQPVLQDVTFSLRPGRTLGLLGRTGSGKTTLTRLLFRLYDPWRGTVRIGGRDLCDMRLEALRREVCMVTQDVHIFGASVRDNLTLFDPTIDRDRIIDVVDQVGLSLWLARLPRGLETELATGTNDLSAGEAQLLAFGRALLRDPGLVILDEPSSRIDPATERLIQRAMANLLANRTGIIIAHRLATIEHVDEIMILDGGRVAEMGAREALATDVSSRFYHLLRYGIQEAIA